MNYKIAAACSAALLFALGIGIGSLLHTLDLIKNLILSGGALKLYYAPVLGGPFKLSYIWDLTTYALITSIIASCVIAIVFGVCLWQAARKEGD